jgi:hypothetical protein
LPIPTARALLGRYEGDDKQVHRPDRCPSFKRVLVLGDRAFDVLSTVLPMLSGGTVRVHDAARRCADLMGRDRTWTPSAVTAMVCRDLRVVPEPSLPAGLTLRPVRRVLEDPMGRGAAE